MAVVVAVETSLPVEEVGGRLCVPNTPPLLSSAAPAALISLLGFFQLSFSVLASFSSLLLPERPAGHFIEQTSALSASRF